jgi:hypothetical protein
MRCGAWGCVARARARRASRQHSAHPLSPLRARAAAAAAMLRAPAPPALAPRLAPRSRRSPRCHAAAALRPRASSLSSALLPPPSEEESRVEAAFRAQFANAPVERALASFTRMARGAPFEHVWPGRGLQQANSYVEGLSAAPFHELNPAAGELGFAWMAALERSAGVIAAELAAASAPGAAEAALKRKGSRIWAEAARAEATAYGPEWRTLVLQDRGKWDATNAALFPQTVRLVRDVATAPSVECFFARQAPGSGIKPHTDNCNFVMTAHLGLDVPAGNCWIKARGFGRKP